MTSSSITKPTLKLLIDVKRGKVLFGEASKGVVDFLFNFVRLLNKNELVGSLRNLYESVEKLNNSSEQLRKKPRVASTLVPYVDLLDYGNGNINYPNPSPSPIVDPSDFNVEDAVIFMVKDDLVIEPIVSTVSSIMLLNKFEIKQIGDLQEKVVELGIIESIDILKAALNSNMVLTDVFLKSFHF